MLNTVCVTTVVIQFLCLCVKVKIAIAVFSTQTVTVTHTVCVLTVRKSEKWPERARGMLTFGGLGDGLLGLGLGLGCRFAFRLDSAFGFLRWCHRSLSFLCFLGYCVFRDFYNFCSFRFQTVINYF